MGQTSSAQIDAISQDAETAAAAKAMELSLNPADSNAFHVLGVESNSPSEEAGLQPFFDYLVAANGVRLNEENETLVTLLKHHLNTPLPFLVYSSKYQKLRLIKLVPSSNWGGSGLLGARIRFCNFSGAGENVWHILEVKPNSPAELAKLTPHQDYIIGTPDAMLRGSGSFAELVEVFEKKPLRLYVYNASQDRCREVVVTPNKDWGGDGSLGCDVGYGYLHRIPVPEHLPSASHPSVFEHTTNQQVLATSPNSSSILSETPETKRPTEVTELHNHHQNPSTSNSFPVNSTPGDDGFDETPLIVPPTTH